jgi:hypothetical protein
MFQLADTEERSDVRSATVRRTGVEDTELLLPLPRSRWEKGGPYLSYTLRPAETGAAVGPPWVPPPLGSDVGLSNHLLE